MLFQLVQIGPAVAVQYWISNSEIANLRDQTGIRARNIVRIRNALITLFVVSIVTIAFMNRLLDFKRFCQVTTVIIFASCLAGLRQLYISRHRNVLANWFGTSLLGLGFLGVGFFGWGFGMLAVMQGIFFIFMSMMLDAQPIRSDLSLFLAAQAGSLPADPEAPRLSSSIRFTRDELFALAKFLGARMMAFDWRRGADWLRLRLAPVTPSPCLGCLPSIWGDASTLTVFTDGRVETHLGRHDRSSLVALATESEVESDALEAAVALAASKALESITAGQMDEADRQIGTKPSADLYRVEPKKTTLARTRKWFLRGVGLLMIAEGIWIYQMQRWIQNQVPPLQSPAVPMPGVLQPSPPVQTEPMTPPK
jgi:hypothetical protein